MKNRLLFKPEERFFTWFRNPGIKIKLKAKMEAVLCATCRIQVTKLCTTIADYLKTFETIRLNECSDINSVEIQINVYIERLKNAHANLKNGPSTVNKS